MPRLKSPEQLEALRKQHVEIAQRIKAAETKARQKHRDDELRRETLIGRLVLNYMADHPGDAFSKVILALLDKGLTRAADRALFPALPPLQPAEPAGADAAAATA